MDITTVNITLVYNPKSGTALSIDELRDKCAVHGITIEHAVDISDDFPASLQPYLTKNALIAAIGGDGTLNSVVQQIYNTEAIFIPLPGGTLNHFIKDSGIAADLDEALANLVSAKPQLVDIAEVNGKIFLNNSSIGIYPTSLQIRENVESKIGKWPAAAIGILRALLKFKLYSVTMEGQTFSTPFIFIGNNDYHLDNGGQRSSLDAGVLCAYAIASPSRLTFIKLLFVAFLGRLKDHDEFVMHRDTTITIHTKQSKIAVSADGEVLRLNTPLNYRSIKQGLTILK